MDIQKQQNILDFAQVIINMTSIMQFVKDLLEYARHGYKMNNMYDLSFNEWLKQNKE